MDVKKLFYGLAFGLLANFLIALTSLVLPLSVAEHAAISVLASNASCEMPPVDESDPQNDDGDECTAYHPNEWKNLGPDSPYRGEPVNFETGNLFSVQTDFHSYGPAPLRLRRVYESDDRATVSSFGAGWRGPYSRTITLVSSTVAKETRDDGRVYTFRLVNGIWRAAPDINDKLAQTASGWVLSTAKDATETYDAHGRLLSIATRAGYTRSMTYDANGNLAEVRDPYGRTLQFSYVQAPVGNHWLVSQVKVPDGGVYAYAYDAQDDLVSVTYPDNTVRKYVYSDSALPHALTGIIDADGNRYTTYTYDSSGRAISTQFAGGVSTFKFDYSHLSLGYVAITHPLGYQEQFALEAINGTAYPDKELRGYNSGQPLGGGNFSAYDSHGNLTVHDDFNDNATSYSYDLTRNLVTSSVSYSSYSYPQTTITWNPRFRLPDVINQPGLTTSFSYDARGRELTQTTTDPATGVSRIWRYSYAPASGGIPGELASVTDPLGNTTRYGYDAQGNLTSITNALGQVTRVTAYDADGRPLNIVDPNGVTTTLTYDARGRLIASQVNSRTTRFTYDPAGNLLKVTLPDGSALSYNYDAAHRLTGITDGLGNRIVYTLDAAGHRIKTQLFDPSGVLTKTASRVYNQVSLLVSSVGAHGQTTRYYYNSEDQLNEDTDGLGHSADYSHDFLGQVTSRLGRWGNDTSYRYDELGHLIWVRDAMAHITTYQVDGFGERTQRKSPDTGTTTYTYDTAGNLATRTDAKGNTISYSYDALNRLTHIHYAADSHLDVTLSYDDPNASFGIGRLTGVSDASGTTHYDYTFTGQLADAIHTIGGHTYSVRYSYDLADRLASITYPNGRVVSYQRDAVGHIQGITTTTASGKTSQLATGISYAPFGGMTQLTYGNGLVLSRQYDTDYRLTSITLGKLFSRSYGYNANNWITDFTDPSGFDVQLGYDFVGRLTSAQEASGNLAWTYDYNGNRTSATDAGVITGYSIGSSNNWLTQLSTGTSKTALSYDPDGNLTGEDARHFVYNAANELAAVDGSSGSVLGSYTYNANGQRVSKTVGGKTTDYIYDQNGQLLAEINDSTGATTTEYIYRDGVPLAMITGASIKGHGSKAHVSVQKHLGVYYILTDGLGTPQMLTNAHGRVAWVATYNPFGQVTITTSKVPFNLRFPGQYYDAETGLLYNDQRYYDPGLGRYISSDPIGLAGGTNTYAYTGDDPTNRIDPQGKAAVTALFGAGVGAYTGYKLCGWKCAMVGGLVGAATGTLFPGESAVVATGVDEMVFGAEADSTATAGEELAPSQADRGVAQDDEEGDCPEGAAGEGGVPKGQTEVVQRWMSKAELEATQQTGLLRGGRDGTHYVTDAANTDALRARQRLALPQTPEVRATLEVPKGSFSPPSKVGPAFNMLGGGMERTATGNIPVNILQVH